MFRTKSVFIKYQSLIFCRVTSVFPKAATGDYIFYFVITIVQQTNHMVEFFSNLKGRLFLLDIFV